MITKLLVPCKSNYLNFSSRLLALSVLYEYKAITMEYVIQMVPTATTTNNKEFFVSQFYYNYDELPVACNQLANLNDYFGIKPYLLLVVVESIQIASCIMHDGESQ